MSALVFEACVYFGRKKRKGGREDTDEGEEIRKIYKDLEEGYLT